MPLVVRRKGKKKPPLFGDFHDSGFFEIEWGHLHRDPGSGGEARPEMKMIPGQMSQGRLPIGKLEHDCPVIPLLGDSGLSDDRFDRHRV